MSDKTPLVKGDEMAALYREATAPTSPFRCVGLRTFARLEDESGQLVAYVGGGSQAEMLRRAFVVVKALNEVQP